MKHFLIVSLIILLFVPQRLLAQTTLPHVFNFHTTLRDDSGNLVESDFIDLEFQIVDGQGKVLFSESQPGVQVIRSAVAVVVGEESGGIPLEVFDPATGSKLLQYKIAGNEFSDGIELNAYPYSLWSEKALGVVDNAIGSEQIKDGSIELKDLARSIEFTDVKGITTEAQIPTSFATDTELAAHTNAGQAHWAKQIRVEGPFMLHTSTNVEDLLSTLDAKVYLNMVNAKEDVTKTSTSLTSSLTQEIADRKAADTVEATARSQADTTLQTNLDTETANRKTEDTNLLASEVSRAGDSVFGNLIFYSDSSLGTETLTITPAEGEMALLGNMVRIEKDDATGQPVIVVEDKDKNEKVKISGGDGTITLNGSLVLSGTVDGVDVGDMNVNLAAHANATTAHGSDGTVVGINTLNSAITKEVTDRTQAITNHATLKTGVHGLTSADPSNAIVGTKETQTLSNKTLESPVINTPTITGGSFSGALSSTTGNHSGTVEGVDISDLNGTVSTNFSNISSLQTTTSDINKIPGTLGESKIDAAITRDTEVVSLVDPTFTTNAEATTIASGQITTALSNNTIPNTPAEIGAAPASHTHASGDLPSSTSYLGGSIESGEISDGTITTSDLNSSSFLGWDQNAGDDVTTATDINNFQGTLGQSKIDGAIARDSEVVTIINNSGNGTVSGAKVDNINNIPGKLDESKIDDSIARDSELPEETTWDNLGTIPDANVPQYMRPAAFGSVEITGCPNQPQASLQNGYNIKSVDGFGKVNFDASVSTPYTVLITGDSVSLNFGSKDPNGFDFDYPLPSKGCPGGVAGTLARAEFVVFKH